MRPTTASGLIPLRVVWTGPLRCDALTGIYKLVETVDDRIDRFDRFEHISLLGGIAPVIRRLDAWVRLPPARPVINRYLQTGALIV